MICLFCKEETHNSKSMEHIIPESLGNSKMVLPPGVVCDKCNNYFAINVEKPFFELEQIKLLRFYQDIPNKRNKIPSTKATIIPGIEVIINKHIKNGQVISSIDVSTEVFEKILSQERNIILFDKESPLTNSSVVSRFIGKIALEAMAQRLVIYPDGLEYLAREIQIDLLRDHVRRGKIKDWPVSIRRIYDADKIWDGNEEPIQVIYEFDILVTEDSEYYFVLALFGLELTINYGGPELDGYLKWLELNNYRSPLHIEKNNVNFT